MKPTFDSRVISRRFCVEWSAGREAVRLYVEARRRRDGSLYWRKDSSAFLLAGGAPNEMLPK